MCTVHTVPYHTYYTSKAFYFRKCIHWPCASLSFSLFRTVEEKIIRTQNFCALSTFNNVIRMVNFNLFISTVSMLQSNSHKSNACQVIRCSVDHSEKRNTHTHKEGKKIWKEKARNGNEKFLWYAAPIYVSGARLWAIIFEFGFSIKFPVEMLYTWIISQCASIKVKCANATPFISWLKSLLQFRFVVTNILYRQNMGNTIATELLFLRFQHRNQTHSSETYISSIDVSR